MKCLLFFLLISLPVLSWAQRYSFVEYSTPEGLPQTQVTSVTQDHLGYLWVGTLGGLAKFNGKEFTSYTTENGLINNKITFVSEIKNQLWVGHEGGVSLLKNNRFKSYALPISAKNLQVSGVVAYGENIIVTTNGAGMYLLEKDVLKYIPFGDDETDRIRDILLFDKTYYIATRSGLFTTQNFKTFQPIENTEDWTISDLQINDHTLYISTFEYGLHELNLNNQKITPIQLPNDFYPRNTFVDNKGRLWFYSNQGILMKSSTGVEFINDKNGLPILDIRVIYQDDEENMWLGSLGKGLIYFPGEMFVHYNKQTNMPTDLVLNVNQNADGSYLIGTYDKGLLHFSKDFKVIHDANKTIWSSALNVMGFNWFGSESGLIQMNGDKTVRVWNTEYGLLSNKITCLYRINNSKMYVAGSGGLQLFSNGILTTLHDNSKKDIGTIRSLAFFEKTLYLATDKGLYAYQKGEIINIRGFLKTTICLANDNDGLLWMGTEEGLYHFNGDKIEQEYFSSETPSKFINLINYYNDQLYIGTNNGLYVLKLKETNPQKRVKHFGIQEGVVNLESNINSGFIDAKGNYWFGTASGLVRFNNAQKRLSSFAPRLLLENILVNYQPFSGSKNPTDGLRIPSSKNNVSFEFDGISLSNPETMKYQYWLEGVENEWSPPTNNSTVAFTGLTSGDYTLHARSVGMNELYSKEIILPFTILPPFYFTWWFILICVVVIAFAVVQIFRFRIRREREFNEKEKMVFKSKLLALEQQSLNASMNRHFIFNSLNSIQYFINTQDKFSANKYLTNFAQLIRKNLDSAGNDGNMIPLSKEIERLKLYLSLEAMRFKDKFVYNFTLPEIDTESILLPAMLLQPFVENSIVHGILPNTEKMGEIEIELRVVEERLHITIVDNGIGFSNSIKNKEHFEGDHRSQGMEITTKRIELIKKISNHAFEIEGPKDNLDENHRINGTYVLLKIPIILLDE